MYQRRFLIGRGRALMASTFVHAAGGTGAGSQLARARGRPAHADRGRRLGGGHGASLRQGQPVKRDGVGHGRVQGQRGAGQPVGAGERDPALRRQLDRHARPAGSARAAAPAAAVASVTSTVRAGVLARTITLTTDGGQVVAVGDEAGGELVGGQLLPEQVRVAGQHRAGSRCPGGWTGWRPRPHGLAISSGRGGGVADGHPHAARHQPLDQRQRARQLRRQRDQDDAPAGRLLPA